MAKVKISCKTCDDGTMTTKKKYRMSGVVVVIGYLFLIPSLIGIVIGAVTIGASAVVVSEADEPGSFRLSETAKYDLKAALIADETIAGLEALERFDEAQISTLTPEQQSAFAMAQLEVGAHRAGTAVGAGFIGASGIFIIVSSLMSGLIGWLLVMKKKVLQCGSCGSVLAAS